MKVNFQKKLLVWICVHNAVMGIYQFSSTGKFNFECYVKVEVDAFLCLSRVFVLLVILWGQVAWGVTFRTLPRKGMGMVELNAIRVGRTTTFFLTFGQRTDLCEKCLLFLQFHYLDNLKLAWRWHKSPLQCWTPTIFPKAASEKKIFNSVSASCNWIGSRWIWGIFRGQ